MIRIAVHVHPGSKVVGVGGSHDGRLTVRVRSRAVDGAASAEVVKSIAKAFGVSPGSVSLLRGAHSRDKLVGVEGTEEAVSARLAELLALGDDSTHEER
jgi:uncharacterized protein (TIGR00251 family)